MAEHGILAGDTLIVDRSRTPRFSGATAKLCDLTNDELSLDRIERIAIEE